MNTRFKAVANAFALAKAIATAIALTAMTAGSASACLALNGEAQAFELDDSRQKEMTMTPIECEGVDTVAEELRSRLDIGGSVFSKIIKSASNPFKSTPST